MKKTSKKISTKKSLKGGRMEWNDGGTSGSPTTLAYDIIGLVIHSINTVTDSIDVIDSINNLPADMGTAFDEQGAPNPNDVKIND